jgi:putative resolvase
MKLSDWARANGISYKTAWLWWKRGKLPVPAYQTPTGTILVEVPERQEAGAVLYARVSSADQKADLDRQVARLAAFAAEQGLRVAKVVAEVGSGLNGHREGLMAVLRSPEYGILVVEHRDRLARFGSESIEAALAASGRRLVVVEPDEVKDDLVQDMIDALTRFCARLYGRRSARRRAERALACAAEDPS